MRPPQRRPGRHVVPASTRPPLREHFGELAGLRLAYVGDGSNVAHSLIEVAALAGANINVASPAGHEVDEAVVAEARRAASAAGGEVVVGDDPVAAVRGAHAVLTDRWVSMGDEAAAADRRRFAPYQVNEQLIALADRDAVFIHCLPARRGEEVTAEVLDGPRSLVWEQVANHAYVGRGGHLGDGESTASRRVAARARVAAESTRSRHGEDGAERGQARASLAHRPAA